jgi:hypothetical protein
MVANLYIFVLLDVTTASYRESMGLAQAKVSPGA